MNGKMVQKGFPLIETASGFMGLEIPYPRTLPGGQERRVRDYFNPLNPKVADALMVGSIEVDCYDLVGVIPADG